MNVLVIYKQWNLLNINGVKLGEKNLFCKLPYVLQKGKGFKTQIRLLNEIDT